MITKSTIIRRATAAALFTLAALNACTTTGSNEPDTPDTPSTASQDATGVCAVLFDDVAWKGFGHKLDEATSQTNIIHEDDPIHDLLDYLPHHWMALSMAVAPGCEVQLFKADGTAVEGDDYVYTGEGSALYVSTLPNEDYDNPISQYSCSCERGVPVNVADLQRSLTDFGSLPLWANQTLDITELDAGGEGWLPVAIEFFDDVSIMGTLDDEIVNEDGDTVEIAMVVSEQAGDDNILDLSTEYGIGNNDQLLVDIAGHIQTITVFSQTDDESNWAP